MTTAKEYMSLAARIGCRICARMGYDDTPSHLHHPRTGVGAGRKSSDFDVIPICPEHHTGQTGIHGMGRKAFERHYGVTEAELTEETKRLVAELLKRRV